MKLVGFFKKLRKGKKHSLNSNKQKKNRQLSFSLKLEKETGIEDLSLSEDSSIRKTCTSEDSLSSSNDSSSSSPSPTAPSLPIIDLKLSTPIEQKLAALVVKDERSTKETSENTPRIHSDIPEISSSVHPISSSSSEELLLDARAQTQTSISTEEKAKSQDMATISHMTLLPVESNQKPKNTEIQETTLVEEDEEETKQQDCALIVGKIESEEETIVIDKNTEYQLDTTYIKKEHTTVVQNKISVDQKVSLPRSSSNSTSSTIGPSKSSDESSNIGHLIRIQILEGSVFDSDDNDDGGNNDDISEDDGNENYYDNDESNKVIVKLPFHQNYDEKNLKKNKITGNDDEATVSSEEFFLMELDELYSHVCRVEKPLQV